MFFFRCLLETRLCFNSNTIYRVRVYVYEYVVFDAISFENSFEIQFKACKNFVLKIWFLHSKTFR